MLKIYKGSTQGMVSVDQISPSKTNTRRPEDFKGAEFEELVASVKEKGVLMPILLRPMGLATYEVVAGERRFRAAVVAGLKEVPAQIVTMTDEQAREAQIVENLQRKDIHPLEEGEAYRKLVEAARYGVETIAAKVGKSIPYVRQRLFLTNLAKPIAEAYRSGKIHDGHAVALARLTSKVQDATWKWMQDEMRYNDAMDVKELREHIQKEEFSRLRVAPPWKGKDIPLNAARCVECEKTGNETLFGKEATAQCADPACYARKMAVWCAVKEKEYKEAGKPLTLVSSRYGHEKGQKLLRKSDYHEIEGKKDTCESAHDALVVEGEENLGVVLSICTDKKCKKHTTEYTPYAPSPKEVEKRRKERKKEEQRAAAKQKKEIAENEALAKKWKKCRQGATLLALALHYVGENPIRDFAKAKGWDVKRRPAYMDKTKTMPDYPGTILAAADGLSDDKVAELAITLFMQGIFSWNTDRKKIIKTLS